MGLLDDMRARTAQGQTGPRCGVERLLSKLRGRLHGEFLEAINDPTIAGAAIADVMKQRGHFLSSQSVARHRRGMCRCDDR